MLAVARDPRPPRFARMGRHIEDCDLPVPRFQVDEHYTGPVPPRNTLQKRQFNSQLLVGQMSVKNTKFDKKIFRFLIKVYIFGQGQFLTEISIFNQNFDF